MPALVTTTKIFRGTSVPRIFICPVLCYNGFESEAFILYSDLFCKVYNEFGWNYYPEAFSAQLLNWIHTTGANITSALDLACGTGVLCEILHSSGIEAAGMDLSEGMIAIARESNPAIRYDVADMTTYAPGRQFDLVTCTGDAVNHILDPDAVAQIFRNVYGYLSPGGYFIFDLLNEDEISDSEPFDLDYSETVNAQFRMLRDGDRVELRTAVYENGEFTFEEVIRERIYDPQAVCATLRSCGFTVERCADRLLDSEAHGTTWFIIARKG